MLVLGSCQSMTLLQTSTVATSQEAANVFVSAYPAVPWSDISAKLAPNNALTIDQARTMAAQTTEVEVSQFLSTFAAGLSVNLAGTAPSSSGAASTALPANAPTPDLTKAPVATGIDAGTLLTAGTALYQEAQILDNQISTEVLPDGYQVYLITFQVNLQPKKKDLNYDAYTDITLLPGNWSESVATSGEADANAGGLAPIKLFPLIITDELETTNVGRSIQSLRQAALQLAGTLHGIGANGSVGGASDKFNSIVGLDKNSLVTAGRVSDSTLRIRLGAENSGSSGQAMVPRSYNVSVVVMTRWGKTDAEQIDRLSVTTNTTFLSPKGETLATGPSRCRGVLAKKVAAKAHEYGYGEVGGDCIPRVTARQPDHACSNGEEEIKTEPEITTYLNLLRAVDRGDYKMVQSCLSPQPGTQEELKLQRVIASLEELQADSRYSTFVIPLHAPSHPTLPDKDQLVVITDDGKQNATAVLHGGKGLIDTKKLRAKLTACLYAAPCAAEQKVSLLPTSISVTKEGAEIDVVFPSLINLGFDPDSLALAAHLTKPPITASAKKNGAPSKAPAQTTPKVPGPSSLFFEIDSQAAEIDGPSSRDYPIVLVKTEAKKTTNPVKATDTVLVADQSGVAHVSLAIGKLTDGGGVAAPLTLVVSGGDVRHDATLGSVLLGSDGTISVSAGTVIILELGNLSSQHPVTVTTMGIVAPNKKPVAIGDPITFTVSQGSVSQGGTTAGK